MSDTLSLQVLAPISGNILQSSRRIHYGKLKQRLNASIRGWVRPDLSVVAVEGSKALGATQDVPPAIAIDDDGREVTFGAEARA